MYVQDTTLHNRNIYTEYSSVTVESHYMHRILLCRTTVYVQDTAPYNNSICTGYYFVEQQYMYRILLRRTTVYVQDTTS